MPHPGTRYYDPKQSGIKSLFQWAGTCLQMVLTQKEFHLYILWNLFLTAACIYAVPDDKVDQFNWDAASIMQYVMTFFVTFYNDMCFARYDRLYPEVVSFSEGVIDMVQELQVNLHWPALTAHRIAASKYLLSVTYLHFMLICGGKLDQDNWNELINKGLLTQQETLLLAGYPGGQVSIVLITWVFFILRDAMIQDCMWRKNNNANDVSQQTVHIYNRFVKHVVNMEKSCNQIGYTLGNPIPFSYYHLMNFILLFNIMLLSTFSALYKSYASVLPFGIALLVYMGLREVSCALAEPFGEDPVDFSVQYIIRNCFDRAVCMLLAFQRHDSRDWVLKQIANVEEIEERHLRRPCKPDVFADDPHAATRGPPAIHTKWTEESCFEDADEDIDLKRMFKFSLNPKGPPEEYKVVDDIDDDETRRLKALAAADIEEERGRGLLLTRDDLEFDYGRLELVLEEIEFKFPELLEYPMPKHLVDQDEDHEEGGV